MLDIYSLTQELIRCPSITPHDGGALDVIQNILEELSFTCERLVFENIDNLYARRLLPTFVFSDIQMLFPSAMRQHGSIILSKPSSKTTYFMVEVPLI